MNSLSTSSMVFLLLFSLFHHLPCASSKQELGLCETLFQCGNITAGFPFSGGNRPKVCGHPSLELRCNSRNITSLSISNQEFNVLQINQPSNNLTLARTDHHLTSFCSSIFKNTTLPQEIFELSPTYQSVTVFYHCYSSHGYVSNNTCLGVGLISASQKPDQRYLPCSDSFTINVPKSFLKEEKVLNLTRLESVLSKGFEVKLKIDENEFCNLEHPLSPRCNTVNTTAEANELHRRCSGTFSCGDRELLYPFWNSAREDCGHPDFKVECNTSSPEVSISSVNYRILEANYDSRIIRLARSDYIGNLCPQNPLDAPFNENVLPFAPNTELLTIYNDCRGDFSQFVSTYVGDLPCDDGSYYVTRNLSSPLLEGNRGRFYDFGISCSNVTIPASGPALNTLRNNRTEDNLKKALEEGFQLGINQECQTCIESGGACGFDQSSSVFVCYCVDGPHNHTCGSKKKRISSRAKIGSGVGVIMFLFLVLTLFLKILRNRKRKTSHDLSHRNFKALVPQQKLKALVPQQNLKALIPLKEYSYANVKRITKSFAEVVGKGGFGTVYRGTLCDGRIVAVKVLKDTKDNNGEDFINEVASMSQTSHVNIVTLLGFCSEGSKRAILYEFLENGSLDKFISSKRSSNMDWKELYGIALGVARGLEYLHHGCRTRIVHFDIKPQNVLLDDNLCPKVSDFGLAKLCERKESILSLLDARGTIGYIAPEVFSRVYGRVSHKSDVYSYGMLVLEMIGARTKTSTGDTTSSTSSMYFPEWIYKDLEKGDNGRLLENGINSEEDEIAKKMTLVGLWCIQSWPSSRPPMNRVVEMMEGSVDALDVPPKPVLQTPTMPLQEASMISEDISVYAEVCSMNVS